MKLKLLILLLIIPIVVLFSYYLFGASVTIDLWYYLILYDGLFALIYGLYLLYKRVDLKKINLVDKLPFILLIIFLIFAIISTINSSNIFLSIFGTSYRKDGLYSYISYIGIGILSMFIIKDDNKQIIYKLFVIVGLILTIFTRLNYVNFLYPIQYSYNGIFFQFNHLAYFFILCLVCNTCLFITSNKKESFIYIISYILMLELLIKNNTFGGYIALLFTTIFILLYYIKIKNIKLKPMIIMITFLVLSLTVSNNNKVVVLNNFGFNINQIKIINLSNLSNEEMKNEELNEIKKLGTGRMGLWLKAIDMIKNKPILGYGIENIGDEYNKSKLSTDKPHNLILGLMVFIGIPGALALLSCFGIVIINNLKNIKIISDSNFIALSGTICYLISSMFGNSMFYTQPYFSIFFGFLLSNIIKKYTKDSE